MTKRCCGTINKSPAPCARFKDKYTQFKLKIRPDYWSLMFSLLTPYRCYVHIHPFLPLYKQKQMITNVSFFVPFGFVLWRSCETMNNWRHNFSYNYLQVKTAINCERKTCEGLARCAQNHNSEAMIMIYMRTPILLMRTTLLETTKDMKCLEKGKDMKVASTPVENQKGPAEDAATAGC